MVSDQGDIYSLHKGKHLTPKKRDSGRLGTMLYKNGKYKNHTISRLVAKAFVPNPRERKEVHHINENPHDNRATNLAWVTRLQNQRLGTCIERMAAGKRVTIEQLTTRGELIKTWEGLRVAERAGFNHGRIYFCCVGKALTHGGFKWRYKK